jgi:hypothetical protein
VLLLRVPSSSSPAKGLYNPKAFITHAASLDQGCPHCPRFPTAASRRSLGRVSVPVWLTILSDQLPITALVGRHPTNQLIGRGPSPGRRSFGHDPRRSRHHPVLAAVSRGCPGARGRYPRVTHPFATRPGAEAPNPVRLACVRRAASVRSEPGSNSQFHPSRRQPTIPRRPLSLAGHRRQVRPARAAGPTASRALPPLRPDPKIRPPCGTTSKADRSPSQKPRPPPRHHPTDHAVRSSPTAGAAPTRDPPQPKMRKTNGHAAAHASLPLPHASKDQTPASARPPCLASGRGFIVIGRDGHKSLFRVILSVNLNAQKFSPRLRVC